MARFSQVVRLDVVDSTSRYAVSAARAGAKEGMVVVADEQTDGRGRLGRRWIAHKGEALLCSIVFRPTLLVADLHLVPTTVALAAVDAIEQVTGKKVALKWPNDLVAGEHKLGGILSEVVDASSEIASQAIVVGLGINLSVSEAFAHQLAESAFPDAPPVSGLSELSGRQIDRDELLAALLEHLEARYSALDSGAESTMADYRQRCSTIGREVKATTAGGEIRGRAVGIASDGALEVDSDGEVVRLEVADVIHLRDA